MTVFKYILIVFHLIAAVVFFMYGYNIPTGDTIGNLIITALFVLAVNMVGVAVCAIFRAWYGVIFAGLSMIVAAPLFFLVGAMLWSYPMSFALLYQGIILFFYIMEIAAIVFFNINSKKAREANQEH